MKMYLIKTLDMNISTHELSTYLQNQNDKHDIDVLSHDGNSVRLLTNISGHGLEGLLAERFDTEFEIREITHKDIK